VKERPSGLVFVTSSGQMPRVVLDRLAMLDRVRRHQGAVVVQAKLYRAGVRCVDLLAVTETRLGYVVSLN